MEETIMNDRVAATAFRHLLAHLRHRHDAQNIDLMGLAGFCRNCLADWISEASAEAAGESGGAEGSVHEVLDREAARAIVYGMPYAQWKARYQVEATAEQLARMEESLGRNGC